MTTDADVGIHQGENIIIKVAVVDQAGNIKNLVGATVLYRQGDLRAITTAFQKAGILTTGGADGVIQVTITDAESATFDAITQDFQFIVTDSDGDIQMVREGEIDVGQLLPASP